MRGLSQVYVLLILSSRKSFYYESKQGFFLCPDRKWKERFFFMFIVLSGPNRKCGMEIWNNLELGPLHYLICLPLVSA